MRERDRIDCVALWAYAYACALRVAPSGGHRCSPDDQSLQAVSCRISKSEAFDPVTAAANKRTLYER